MNFQLFSTQQLTFRLPPSSPISLWFNSSTPRLLFAVRNNLLNFVFPHDVYILVLHPHNHTSIALSRKFFLHFFSHAKLSRHVPQHVPYWEQQKTSVGTSELPMSSQLLPVFLEATCCQMGFREDILS